MKKNKSLETLYKEACEKRDAAFRAGNFANANRWIKKVVSLGLLIEQRRNY